mgnify:CR=1 FL=1
MVEKECSDVKYVDLFFLMIRRPPRSTLDRSTAASDVYKRQDELFRRSGPQVYEAKVMQADGAYRDVVFHKAAYGLSLIHISEPTRPY